MRNIIASIALASTAAFAGDSPHTQPSGFPTVTALAIDEQTLVIEGSNLVHAAPVGSEFWLDQWQLECSGASDLLACDIPIAVQPGTSYAMTAAWWLDENRVEYVLSVAAPSSPMVIETSFGGITHQPIVIEYPSTAKRGSKRYFEFYCAEGVPVFGNMYLDGGVHDWSVYAASVVPDYSGRPMFEVIMIKTPRTDGVSLVDVGQGFTARGQMVCAQ